MLAESVTAFTLNFTGSDTLQDYDALCVFIGGCSDTDVLWRDTGLYDEFGNGRPAYTRWIDELAVPLQ